MSAWLKKILTDRFWKVLSCVALVVVADSLFYEDPGADLSGLLSIRTVTTYSGWTTGMFIVLLSVMAAIHLSSSGKNGRSRTAAILALAGLGGSFIVEPSGLAFFLILICMPTIVLICSPGWEPNASLWAANVAGFAVKGWLKIFPDLSVFAKSIPVSKRFGNSVYWVIPLSLSAVFILLFALANPVIENNLEFLMEQILNIIDPNRWFFWVLAAMLSWPLIYPDGLKLPSRPIKAASIRMDGYNVRQSKLISIESITRGLVLFNIIFLIQTSMDIIYLWGGRALPEGLTYAGYAHRGAYPLILTALLAGAFVIIALRHGSGSERSPLVRRLVYLWIAQNVFLVFSSIWRTLLYIDVYSLTLLRVSALVWMGLVAAGLLSLIVRIQRGKSDKWLIDVNVLIVFVVLYISCFVNVRGLIAEYNVRHSFEGRGWGARLDVQYLVELGPSSMLALNDFCSERLAGKERQAEAKAAIEKLDAGLKDKFRDWRGWTLQRHALSGTSLTNCYEPAAASQTASNPE